MAFFLFIGFIVLLRMAELIIASRNEKWMLQQGAIEFGKSHYPFMVAMHTLFFVSLLLEYIFRTPVNYVLEAIIIYMLLILLKTWVIFSLGKYWNTKILRIPNAALVNKGLYKFIKLPNYIIVIIEIALIPLSFHLYFTAITFSILNAAMLYVRIRTENKALNN